MKNGVIVGLGGVGQRHLRNLKSLMPDINVAAIRKRSKTFEINNSLVRNDSVDINSRYSLEIINETDISTFNPSFAIIANPSAFHSFYACQFLKRDIPVFIEKPAAITLEELNNLTELAEKKKTITMVGYQLRFHPCYIKLKEYLNNEVIGDLTSIEVNVSSYLPEWHPYEDFNDLYASNIDMGGGVILTESHEIDLISDLFGKIFVEASIGGNLSSNKIKAEDTVCIISHVSENDRKVPVTFNLSFMRKPLERIIRIHGDLGLITLDLNNNKIIVEYINGTKNDELMIDDFDRNLLFIDELKHFLECIESNQECKTSLENTRLGLAAVLDVKEKFLDLTR
ncbi:Gfo/Idh/MocA family oxidoreductase [Gammaproteobacteria bacterium]|nr:Gfo/Idh/MocA family oxidoreductase [Gammaproteobacteria bacterium]